MLVPMKEETDQFNVYIGGYLGTDVLFHYRCSGIKRMHRLSVYITSCCPDVCMYDDGA